MATLNSSNITDGNTIEPTDILQLYDALTPGGGTTGAYNVTVSGSLIGNASTSTSASFATSASRAVSSSFATTASFALNATATVSQVNNQYYIDSSDPSIVSTGNFKFIAGGGTLNAGSFISSIYPLLVGKTIGQNAWINASYIGDTGIITAPEPTLVINISGSGQIIIDQLDGNNDATIVWTGVCI
jgi:hypothetical protein